MDPLLTTVKRMIPGGPTQLVSLLLNVTTLDTHHSTSCEG
jgi:hypothetical protein